MRELMLSRRLKRRLIVHHCVLLFSSAALIAALYLLMRTDGAMFRLSMATAYTGTLLLGTTLLIGPLRILRKRPAPPGSDDLRRDIGIWAGVVSILHVVVGLQVHMNSMLLYFLREAGPDKWLQLRTDPFGLANYTGLLAAVILMMLVAISNDYFVRWLGLKKWKTLQRWNYCGFGLIALHGVIYQIIEKRALPYPIIFGSMILLVIAVQLAAFRLRKAGESRLRRDAVIHN